MGFKNDRKDGSLKDNQDATNTRGGKIKTRYSVQKT